MQLSFNLKTFEGRYYLILCVLSSTVFFSYSISSLSAILLILNSFSAPSGLASSYFKKERILYLFAFTALLYTISFFTSNDTSNLNLWTQKLLYLVPLLGVGLGYSTLNIQKLNTLFKLTILSVLLFFGYSIIDQVAIMISKSTNYLFLPSIKNTLHKLQTSRLMSNIVHVAYVSNFAGILAILVWKKGLFKSFSLKLILSFLFVLFLLLLQARTNIISFVLACLIFIPFLFSKEKSLKKGSFKLIIILISTTVVLFSIPEKIKNRFAQLANYNFNYSDPSFNSVNVRAALWTIAVDLIKEKPIIGYGLGDSKGAFHEEFKEKNFKFGLNKKFNCHNQYLETSLATGLIGLITLLLPILILGRTLFLKRRILELAILLYFMGSIAAESMLERHWGLMFLNVHLLIIVLSFRLQHEEKGIEEGKE